GSLSTFSSPLQPLDETPATLVPADCPRPWATTYPACQRCVVTRGARISHPFCCRTTATTFPPASRSKFAAVAQVSKWNTTTVLILIFSSANGVKLSSGREGQVRVLVR